MRVVVCLALLMCCMPLAAEPGELEARTLVQAQATGLVAAGRFGELDQISRAYVVQSSRTSSGLWKSGLLVDAIVNALTTPAPTSDGDWRRQEKISGDWAARAPESALARLVHAKIIRKHGWSIRGGGYAYTVKADAWVPFRRQIERAREYIESEKSIASRNPEYYSLMIQLIKEGGGEDDPSPVLADGMVKFPDYYPMYFSMLDYLLPKWHGDASKIETFTRMAAARTSAIEGDSMYARIYWYASQSQYEDDLFISSFAHWDLMQKGFEDVIKRYPDQWNLQNYAKFACEVGDTRTLSRLLDRIEQPVIEQAWGSRERFDACERSAGRLHL